MRNEGATMRDLAQLLKGNTDVLLLSLLESEPMYGYQMIKELERRSQGFLRFGCELVQFHCCHSCMNAVRLRC